MEVRHKQILVVIDVESGNNPALCVQATDQRRGLDADNQQDSAVGRRELRVQR